MSTQEVSLGSEVEKSGVKYRVIRIVRQTALFEDTSGELSVVEEHYLELKAEDGTLDFDILSSERTNYLGPTSTIKAPETIVWRKD